MKTAAIVSIGNELLNGRVTDTNVVWLGGQLRLLNVDVVSCYTAGDDVEMIARMLGYACSDADVVIVTGGLGPTDDDITRQGVAKLMGVELELRGELLETIEGFFARRGAKMAATNEVQAYLPVGAVAIANNAGTAPGFVAEVNGKSIFVLPGVPSEMELMFKESVLGEIEKKAVGQKIAVRKLRCCGKGESSIAEKIGDLMRRGRNPLINCTASAGVVTLEIVGRAETCETAEKMVAEDSKLLCELLGDIVFGFGDETLSAVVGRKLASQNKTLTVAESCTGGLVGKMITDIPGSSQYFLGGWLTYSDESKIKRLGVDGELIKKYGAVSEQVAEAMADGARKNGGSDFAIAITGIAGPGGGSEQKPVGLTYIAIADENGARAERFLLGENRNSVRFRAAIKALDMLRSRL